MKKGVIGGEDFRKYFFWVFVVILFVMSYFIVKPYFIALVSAFILAYLVRPVSKRLERFVGKSFSAIISIVLVVLVIILPLVLIVGGAVQQGSHYLSQESIEGFLEGVSSYPLISDLNLDFVEISEKGVSFFISLLSSAVSYMPSLIISVFITLFAMFYILANWDILSKNLRNYIPFRDRKNTADEISRVTNVLVYGTLLMAFIEFGVAFIGFYFLGVEFYLLLSLLIFFFAFIPALGPALVWVPMTIYYFVVGDYFMGVSILVLGLILSVAIDAVLKSKILGGKAKVNPLIILVGILGGIPVFGIFGFIIGPLILIYTIEILEEVIKNN